jgi:hypothetical protein
VIQHQAKVRKQWRQIGGNAHRDRVAGLILSTDNI